MLIVYVILRFDCSFVTGAASNKDSNDVRMFCHEESLGHLGECLQHQTLSMD